METLFIMLAIVVVLMLTRHVEHPRDLRRE